LWRSHHLIHQMVAPCTKNSHLQRWQFLEAATGREEVEKERFLLSNFVI